MTLHSKIRAIQLGMLNDTRVASPCPANWDEMEGDEKVRYCSGCQQHVYNLSEMHVEEAAERLTGHIGRLCVRFYRRVDGTVLTRDCPVGEERKQRRRRAVAFGAAAVLGAGVAGTVLNGVAAVSTGEAPDGGQARVLAELLEAQTPHATMGMVAPPSREELRQAIEELRAARSKG